MRLLSTALLFAFVAAGSAPLSADVNFFSPDSASIKSPDIENPSFPVVNLIDQGGLASTPVTLSNINSILHTDGGFLWRSDLLGGAFGNPLPVTVILDFNVAQQINYVGLWQGFSGREGVENFNLRFFEGALATGNQIGGLYSDILDPSSVGTGNIPVNGRAFDVGLRNGVRSMELEIVSTAIPDGVDFVHLGEVMVAPVPEPSVLSALGLGCLIYFGRSRRRRIA